MQGSRFCAPGCIEREQPFSLLSLQPTGIIGADPDSQSGGTGMARLRLPLIILSHLLACIADSKVIHRPLPIAAKWLILLQAGLILLDGVFYVYLLGFADRPVTLW
jgi:hypothetical protein